jgi:heparosan-N-sulfate-glucuronate 5-epimerase
LSSGFTRLLRCAGCRRRRVYITLEPWTRVRDTRGAFTRWYRSRCLLTRDRNQQGLADFAPRNPQSGFYNDLRHVALAHTTAGGAVAALRDMSSDRLSANPVSVAQLGLGAWQLSARDPSWLAVVAEASSWLAANVDTSGRLAYLFPMPHTYTLAAPWYSAMAQGEAVSLLVRAAHVLRRADLLDTAAVAAQPLLESQLGLIVDTPEGPVLQEYPTRPPSHVLNGWVFALWGLYDVAAASVPEPATFAPLAAKARDAFESGVRSLAARLSMYETAFGWSRYDLYPHRIVHVASPFYQRLHVSQLRAMAVLRPDLEAFSHFSNRWEAALQSPAGRSLAIIRKIAFRVIAPRRRPLQRL